MNTEPEILTISDARLGLNEIELDQTSEGWRYSYHISVSAGVDGSYGCGHGAPPSKQTYPTRSDAIYAATDEMKKQLNTLGTWHKRHKKDRQRVRDWLDSLAPAQMELF